MSAAEGKLFGPATPLPEGFVYVTDFIDEREERTLLEAIGALPLEAAPYREYTARRRIALFEQTSEDAREEGMPEFLRPLRDRIGAWLGVAAPALAHALVNEYRPGTPLGWHRDAPTYERVAGVSLGGWARMRLRPHPRSRFAAKNVAAVKLELAPRSAYRMEGPARWEWQHSISATRELRYSITFRTLRTAAGALRRS